MAKKSKDQIADKSREMRLKMHALVESGIPEQDALVQVTPGDPQRYRKLPLWKKHELWPVPTEELTTSMGMQEPEGITETANLANNGSKAEESTERGPDTDLEQLILDKVTIVIQEAKQDHDAQQVTVKDRLTALEDTLQTLAAKLDNLAVPAIESPPPQIAMVVTIDMSQDPPSPGKEGKKFLGRKADLRARIDANLSELFEQEIKRYAGNASRALDAILWRYFGMPKLSFELGTPEPATLGDDH